MTDIEHNKALVERYYGELNRGNLSIIDELIAEDYVAHDPNLPADLQEGIENVHLTVARSRAAMPDQHIEIDDLVAERDLVAFRIKVYGHLDDDGVSSDEREISFTGMGMMRIKGNQIAEGWFNFDHYSLLQQLGALPADTRGWK